MRIISYYTIDTPYEREAARLRQSIDKLGIEHNIVGLPSLGRAEDFNQLTDEAESGFALSQDIALTSPVPDQLVAGDTVSVTGNLLSGLNGQSEVIAYVNGVLYTLPVASGFFNGSVPVSTGENTIILMAGTMSQSDWKRNGATLVRNVSGIIALNKVAFYNCWAKNQSDLDLYVIEPQGEAVWSQRQRSKSLLSMVMDNESGYGPEAIMLKPDNDGQVLPGQYLVRVHYRADLGGFTPTGPVVGRVTVVLNEGSEDMQLYAIPYELKVSNPDNISPDGEGDDWADIALIDVANGVVTPLTPGGM